MLNFISIYPIPLNTMTHMVNPYKEHRSKLRSAGESGRGGTVSPLPVGMLGSRAASQFFFGFLRPVDWLKSIQIWWFFSSFGFFYFHYILLWHWKTSNLAEQEIEIAIKYKYEIVQHPGYHYALLQITQNWFRGFLCGNSWRRVVGLESRVLDKLIFPF